MKKIGTLITSSDYDTKETRVTTSRQAGRLVCRYHVLNIHERILSSMLLEKGERLLDEIAKVVPLLLTIPARGASQSRRGWRCVARARQCFI